MSPLPDPILLLGLTKRDIAALVTRDAKFLAPMLLSALGIKNPGQQQASRDALYQWAYAYLEPRFTQYQSWATGLATENYSAARLEAVGTDGFSPQIYDRGAGVDAFVGWMLSSFNADAARRLAAPGGTKAPRVPATQGNGTGLGSYHLGKLRFSHVAGMTSEDVAAAMQAAMDEGAQLRTMGAYNDTMTGNALRDPLAEGWIRVAEPDACAFCLMLASRGNYGILYRSEQTANFRAHTPGKNGGGLCRCHALPAFAAGRVRKLGAMPSYAADSPYAAYVENASVFLDANGARGLVAA